MKKLVRRIRNFFITTFIGGLVVILPITIFVFLVRFFFQLGVSLLEPLVDLIPLDVGEEYWMVEWLIYAAVVAIIFLTCFLVGLIIRTQFGKSIWSGIEKYYLMRLPLYSSIREVVLQVTGKAKDNFSKVVIVDVFGTDTRMTGFVTDEHPNGMVTIFVPTAPNPTNGFVFHVKREQVKFVDTSTEAAMRSIIAVGTGSSDVISREKLT